MPNPTFNLYLMMRHRSITLYPHWFVWVLIWYYCS